ncbi:MAG: [protein-PII] uridylyltransferase [Burkholderiales bacterium]|nr:[protein-PII] uridylyltransferase [Burkholderiales bacterium]
MNAAVRAEPPAPARWREFLTEHRNRLREEYTARPDPARLLKALSQLIDQVLTCAAREIGLPPEVSLLAVGGYGRRELFPYSDIDLLVLLKQAPDDVLAPVLEHYITYLWDIGLEVGHSVRTLDECLSEARKDITVETTLLEARLIDGSATLFHAFQHALDQALDGRAFMEGKLLEQQQRHLRFHDATYNLEPNLKENPGGLRDLQTILWISRALGLGASWQDLLNNGLLAAEEVREIRQAERLLRDLRIRLHFLARRREDRLLFDYQAALAQALGFNPRGTRSAAEILMQHYYRAAKRVGLKNKILLLDLKSRAHPATDSTPQPINARFAISRGMLEACSPDLFERESSAILEAFLLLQQQSGVLDMSAQTLRSLIRATGNIDAAFRRDPYNRQLFLAILRAPRGLTHALRRMNQYGVLGRYIPAFGRIVGQMQHDLFHVYTVDEHILFVVRNLRRFAMTEFAHEYPLCSRLIHNFERPEVLYLAGLFHDIAKGRGGDHSTLGAVDARKFCREHGLHAEDAELVAWLVSQHLMMSATAQKQDLSDPDIIAAFAAKVGDMRRLTALYLLTVADIRGTSPKVWNAWKGKLLEDLFRAAQRLLTGGAAPLDQQMEVRKEEARKLLRQATVPEEAQTVFWHELNDSYFLRHTVREIAWHTRHLHSVTHSARPVVHARSAPEGEGIQVMIYTLDRDDLFARICAFFERINYTIVDAKIYTTPHHYALDTFLVLDMGETAVHYRDLLSFIEFELTQRLVDDTPPEPPMQGRVSRQLKHFPIQAQVAIVPDEKGQYHLLSVTAGDRPGLLSRIAQVLLKHGVHLHTAKIITLGDRAEDVFLVRADDDRLLNQKIVLKIETDLLQALA